MSLTAQLDSWRNPDHWDDTPTDEQVLRQFVFSAISDFITENEVKLSDLFTSDMTGDDIDALIDKFVDDYAEAA